MAKYQRQIGKELKREDKQHDQVQERALSYDRSGSGYSLGF